jgi:replicative DNA helicase
MKEISSRIHTILNSVQGGADRKELVYQLKRLLYEISENEINQDPDWYKPMNLTEVSRWYLDSSIVKEMFIPTGFEELDSKRGGFKRGELISIISNRYVGRTDFMLNLALSVSLKTPVLYCSFDQPKMEIMHRCFSFFTGLTTDKLNESVDSSNYSEHSETIEREFKKRKLFVYDIYPDSFL